MPAEGILQTVQKIATAVHRLDEMAEDIRYSLPTASDKAGRRGQPGRVPDS